MTSPLAASLGMMTESDRSQSWTEERRDWDTYFWSCSWAPARFGESISWIEDDWGPEVARSWL